MNKSFYNKTSRAGNMQTLISKIPERQILVKRNSRDKDMDLINVYLLQSMNQYPSKSKYPNADSGTFGNQ